MLHMAHRRGTPPAPPRRLDHVPEEHRAGVADRLKLQRLLRAEVPVHPGFAHPQLPSELPDRQGLQAVQPAKLVGALEDSLPARSLVHQESLSLRTIVW